jgi:molybdate transport system ATP-binding protein
MKLEVKIIKKLPEFTIDVSFSCRAGDMQIITGPSGSGKTTIMRILAGLERSDHGLITYNGKVWEDTANRIFVKPQQRAIGYVFQEYSLFPHLTVEKNIDFGARDRRNVERHMRLLGIGHLAKRLPNKLSGGERQRVALAQALAREPQTLLLDEPFSALDYLTKEKLRRSLDEIKRLVQIPIIHITHDIVEGLRTADSVLPLEQGRIACNWLPETFRAKLPETHFHVGSGERHEKPAPESAVNRIATLNRLFGSLRTCKPDGI